MVAVRIEGVDELLTYLNGLPKKITKHLDKGNYTLMNDIKKMAIRRAPEDTRELADSITLTKTKTKGKTQQYKIEVGAAHGIFQEFGFKPHQFISDPGRPGFNTNKLPLGQLIYVKKWTPFIQPAITHNLLKFDKILEDSITKALK